MDSRTFNNSKMMKSVSMNDLHHAIPQTQKYKSSKWGKENLVDFYSSLPNVRNNLDSYSPQGQKRLINTLAFENDLLKLKLSKVYDNEK